MNNAKASSPASRRERSASARTVGEGGSRTGPLAPTDGSAASSLKRAPPEGRAPRYAPWAGVETGSAQDDPKDRSRADFVYDAVRSAIQAGQIGRGKRVREEEVAELLGVSRTPVREALRRLQATGLLEITHGRGLSVSVIGRRQLLELFDMREMLEAAAARFAAQHASESEVGLLRNLLAESTAVEHDPLRTASLNRVFHHAIYDAAHNRYLLGSLREIYDSMALLGKTTYAVAGRARSAHEEHTRIVDAIAARDPDAADIAARLHIGVARRTRLEIFDAER